MDRFTKTSLVVIIFLLAVIAIRPMVFPPTASAQQHYTYRAVRLPNQAEPQAALDKYAADGWELAGAYSTDINAGNQWVAVLIFRK